MIFQQIFISWLENSLRQQIPDGVIAFSFNLYEPAGEVGVKYGIELIGAESFDEEDSDWACDEAWEPTPRGISIPIEYSGVQWKICLKRLKDLIVEQHNSDSPNIHKLKKSHGIAIGFVDGDLEVIWRP